MQRRWSGVVLLAFMIGFMGWPVGPVRADEGHGAHGGEHMKVSGTVTSVKSGVVFVKTSWGHMSFSAGAGPADIKEGEEVVMTMSENNIVIDVHRKGEPAHHHRHLTGTLTQVASDRKEITIQTPEGEKTFPMQTGRSQLSGLKKGATISVELNDAGKVIDVHKASVSVTIEANPRTLPGYRIKVNGKVTKMASGVVHVETPSARYSISAKTVPSDLKVGDELTLWVNENNVVVDHHRKGAKEPHHRLLTGKLAYASPEKKEIKLWTPEGEKTFDVQTGKSKLSAIEEGSMVTVEVNESGKVIDIRKGG